ncbi:MAG: hypothetical protein KC912_21025 [Proteobacteria bacterium]|nr:hypothetical protein [Pseudomonadota bacterium]
MRRSLTLGWLFLACPAFAGSSTVKASSELKTDDTTHRAALAFDGLLQTSWIEGEDGSGEGSWIELSFDRTRTVESVSVWVGDLSRGRRSLREYARARDLTFVFSGSGDDIEVKARVPDLAEQGPTRLDVRIDAIEARKMRVRIDKVYDSYVSDGAAIAEVAINYTRGEAPGSVATARGWVDSSAGKRSVERSTERARELFTTLTENDEDREALGELIERASDGLESVQARLRSVPYGFRAAALASDSVAIDALLKLKNPNGIPGVELAATRAVDRDQKTLQLKTQMFYAYQELLGGPSPVPNWGREGWESGAMRGFGEPLNVSIDQLGQTYVADLGNHRIQRFDDQGVVNGTWGSCDAPDIANRWFGGTRRFHVSGCLPSEADGGFVNPLDVAVLPGKEGDGFAALDVTGRIQIFGAEGQHVRSFQTNLGSTPVAGVGGQGFLELIKGRLVAVLGDEVGVYTLEGEQQSTFVLEYGSSSGAVGLKGGKLGLVQGRELVMFSLDGYEHGPVLGEADLGTDFEYWDVATDEKNRLWVLTDDGKARKFKKPGKLEWEGSYGDGGVMPRFQVVEGVLFLSADDALQLVPTGI